MASSKCIITFDNNPFGVYYAGQVVSGTAELVTTRPKTIRSISITISGFAEVRWTEDVTKQDAQGNRQKAIETFSSSEIYYSSDKYVYGQSGGSQLELPAGKYVFPFQGTIPPNAPTSFNGAWGQIQHEVTLTIDRVMRYNNVFKQAYTVVSPFDLNLNPIHAKPLHKIEEKTFCWSFCCGNKGPMVMTAKTSFSAFAPGQKVRFHIVLDNQSDVHCYDVKVRLMKKVVYTSRSPETKTKETEIKVADNHCGEVVKLNKAEFNEFLQIPSTTPSSLESCSIIKISYTLKFIAKVSRIHGDLVIEFPITIGTVPIYASTADPEPIMAQPNHAPVYKPLPPPMFEEDVRSEQFESNTFKPRYPVFLNDGDLALNGNAANGPPGPPPPTTNNLYPTPHPTAVTPTPPRAAITPTAPPSSVPSAVMPMPPSTVTQTSSNKPAAPTHQPSLEVLGFSIPPDYEPTETDPALNIGWK
ncbi:arrestin domain-containing protein 3 [Haematobia irritans]|uniref:arrestin domain-containing protein 3 n=1 Tax=Haematobia irritans TaxID=7368 RepID=UPI003F502EF5